MSFTNYLILEMVIPKNVKPLGRSLSLALPGRSVRCDNGHFDQKFWLNDRFFGFSVLWDSPASNSCKTFISHGNGIRRFYEL